MCGLAGHIGRWGMPALGESALKALRHRPSDSQCAECRTAADVTANLAAADWPSSTRPTLDRQPMSNEDGRFTTVFNGEIYNWSMPRRECERSGHRFRSDMDDEVIRQMWETEGPAALRCLNGIFVVAVLDTTTGELVQARSPLGVKPLAYAEADGELSFASELRAPLPMRVPTGGSNLIALAQFLSFIRIPKPRTPYARVRSIEPRNVLRRTPRLFDSRRCRVRFSMTQSRPAVRLRQTGRAGRAGRAAQASGDRRHAPAFVRMGTLPEGSTAGLGRPLAPD